MGMKMDLIYHTQNIKFNIYEQIKHTIQAIIITKNLMDNMRDYFEMLVKILMMLQKKMKQITESEMLMMKT